MNISIQDEQGRQMQQGSSTLDDISSFEETSNVGPTSQAYLLGGSQNSDNENSKEVSITIEEEGETTDHENSMIEHEVNSPAETQNQPEQTEGEEDDYYEAESPMQTEYTSEDTDEIQYQSGFVEEPVNPLERVEDISDSKMRNLKSFLILNFFANLLGFLTQVEVLSYLNLFLFVFMGIVYMIIKSIRDRTCNEANRTRALKLKAFRVANWACLGLYFLMVVLKQAGKIENLSPWTIPGCLSIFLESFYLSSNYASGEKGLEISMKYAVWVQIFLIALKVDGANLPWSFTLFVFISFGFVSLMVALILFIICVSSMFGVPCYNSTGRTAVIGSGWYFLISMANVLWGVITLHGKNLLISREEVSSSSSFLLGFFSFGLLYGGCLLYFTRRYYNTLFLFLKYEALHDLQEAGEMLNFNTNNLVPYEGPKYQYLARITSTYFSTIQRSFQIKDRVALLKWNKEMKRAKFYKFFPHKKSKFVSKSNLQSPCTAMPKATRSTSLGMEGMTLNRLGKMKSQMSEEEMFSPCMELRCHKVVYSFDDRDVAKKVKRPGDEAIPTEEKDLCIVCYETEPNAVIMDCGHGGVCYDCAIKSWENSDKCHMCRGDIRTILKVKNLPLIKVVKVLDETEKIIQSYPKLEIAVV